MQRSSKTETKLIEQRMELLGEDFFTARKAIKRKDLERVHPSLTLDCFADDKQLPDEGAWIQVIMPPHCVVTCEALSIWFATPAADAKTWDYMEGDLGHRYKVKVLTPVGEFTLFASEYNLVTPDALNEYIGLVGSTKDETKEHVMLHWLDPRNEYFDADRLFYIQSRGVGRADAYKMLMGEVKSPHVCYFTFHEEYQRYFAGVGVANLHGRSAVEAHIKFVAREKEAGRWYNLEYTKQELAEQEAAEKRRETEKAEQAVIAKNRKATEKRFAKMLPSFRL
mgnify:CR=1 FL=1